MKKFVLSLVFAFLLSSVTFGQLAYGAPQDAVKVVLNSQQLEFDVNPYIKDGRTMVPFRKVLEAMDVRVAWNKDQRMVLAYNDVTKIQLVIGEKNALVNGKSIQLDVPSEITDGRTFIPLRFFSENLGANVEWKKESKTVDISYSSGKYAVGSMASFGDIKVSIDNVKKDNENNRVYFSGKINAGKTLTINVFDDNKNSVFGIVDSKLGNDGFNTFEGFANIVDKNFVAKHILIRCIDGNGKMIKIAQFDIAE